MTRAVLFVLFLLAQACSGEPSEPSEPSDLVTRQHEREVTEVETAAALDLLPEIEPATEGIGSDAREALRAMYELREAESVAGRFYERRGFELAWYRGAVPTPQAQRLAATLARADEHGLADEYAVELPTAGDAEAAASADSSLTETAARLGKHLLLGKVSPITMHSSWTAPARVGDLVSMLEELVKSDDMAPLEALAPQQARYRAMRRALARYRTIAEEGGWPDDIEARLGEETLTDFQRRHGLRESGELDQATRDAASVSVEDRIEQLRADLERWRWLPDELGRRHVLVNIANFELEAREAGEATLRLRVMVGKRYRKTPVFSDAITHLVLNPRWNVPREIATRDLLREARRNPRYLEQRNIRAYDAEGREISVREVPWRSLSHSRFPYTLRQDSGTSNALGRIKFMFPNQHAVYLHDTPRRDLFDEPERAFSSGCIRVEDPLALAVFLLNDPAWSREALENRLERRGEQTIRLSERTPVHLLYWTSWARDDVVHFRSDIYDRNADLLAALDREE